MICEKDLWPGADRDPPAPPILRIATLCPLVDEDRLDGELIIRLKQQVFYYPESLRIFEKRSWVINRRTEIAGCSLTILDRKPVVAAVPFQSLMTDTECVSVRGGNYSSALCSPALRSRKIEPRADFAARRRHVIETYINVVLRVIASVGNDVGSGAGEICQRHFANPNIPILNPSAVTTHVRDIEIVDVRLITPVISLTGPKLGARLTLQYIANLNEGLTQPELIVTDASRKIG